MLDWLFGKKKPTAAAAGETQQIDDSLWVSHAARRKGLARQIGILVEAERSVVVVALSSASLDETMADLAQFEPARCGDVFAKDALQASMLKPGAVAVTGVKALQVGLSMREDGVDILVIGRHKTRTEDDAMMAFAHALGSGAHVEFHLALDDPLLAPMRASLAPLLQKLGAGDDEPIQHAFVSRAIANAQAAAKR